MIFILISLMLSVVVLYVLNVKAKVTNNKALFILPFIVFYLCYVLTVFTYSEYLEYVLYTYDLNEDRIFEESEKSLDQNEAMIAVVNDTGRTLGWFFGLLYASLFSFVVNCFRFFNKNKE